MVWLKTYLWYQDDVDVQLCARLIEWVCEDAGLPEGAVLVFLPGWAEINQLKQELESSSKLGGSRYSILPLHSMIPAHEQRKVHSDAKVAES